MAKKEKVIEFPKPEDKMIDIPTRVLEALINAVLSGSWTAATDVANEVQAIAQEQNPTYFKK